jgi:hypothetical protein
LAHNEKTGILQPLKSDMPFHCVRWAREKGGIR